jgi:MFS family permease
MTTSSATPPEAPLAEPPSRQLWTIFLTIFLDVVGFSIIFPLFPALLKHYLATEGDAGAFGALIEQLLSFAGSESEFRLAVLFGGVLGSLYSLLQFLLAPIWGSLSDRVGRRPVLLVTIAGMALSYALWGIGSSFALFVVSRLLGGIMGGNISVATAAVADATADRDRAKGMGLVGAAFGLGFILGPALGGLLSLVPLDASFGRWIGNPFSAVAFGACLLSVLNWIVVWRRFRDVRGEAKAHETSRSANLLRLLRPSELPGVNRSHAAWFVYLMAFSGMEFTLTFLAVDRFGFSPRANAEMFVFVGLVMVVVQGVVVRRLGPRVGERRLALVGLLTSVPGFVVTGTAPHEGALYLGLFLIAVGGGLFSPALTALVSLYAPRERQGEVIGVFRSLGALARAIGPFGACLTYWHLGATSPYISGAALLLVPLAVVLGLPQPAHRMASAPPDALS